MADEHKGTPSPFHVDTVREIISLMDKFGLSEIDLNDGDQRIRLRKGPRIVPGASLPAQPAMMAAPLAVAPAVPAAAAEPAKADKKYIEIKSELVGTFYAKPAPDKDDFVKVGSKVSPDTVVCKVEAMKIFNDITAKISGKVVEVCVQNSQFVEFDQVLFRVDPNG
ncbi:acetyl-CoA carboxylase biotin carboxyl carrier protein [Zavarzinella formosa]|uniref:acetyl-CoA carboxylase biotin carboxyl carrier protein n=1 Tax=Zavarzinella formosa TaxID=360055 RepID=UPI0003141718|nr:acetyl-CoA carboxylase biotin carboxyl carrier protein [Zavarzinella formosa]